MLATLPAHLPRTRLAFLAVALAALMLAGCGLVESIVEDFVDDQDVEIPARNGRSGSVVHSDVGAELFAQQDLLIAGDGADGSHVVGILSFPIDSSVQPDKTRLDNVRIRVWLEVRSGDPTTLGPLIVSHLPNHPDLDLATGQVPHPPGNDVGTIDDLSTGWHELNITSTFRQDWNAGRDVSVFALRLTTPTNSDLTPDTLGLEGDDGDGNLARPEVILHFSVDL